MGKKTKKDQDGQVKEGVPEGRLEEGKPISLFQLFLIFFKINFFTFGGGYTIIPVIRDEFVDRRKAIAEEEMLDLLALAQSGPGSMAVSASILTGYKVRGPMGAMVCLLASILPCFLVITVLYHVLQALADNPWVQAAFSTMGGMISAVLLVTTIRMGKGALSSDRRFGTVLMAAVFILSFVFELDTAALIFLSGLTGFVFFSLPGKGGDA